MPNHTRNASLDTETMEYKILIVAQLSGGLDDHRPMLQADVGDPRAIKG